MQILELCKLAAESGCNEPKLKTTFLHGLNADVVIELVCWNDQVALDAIIDLAIWLAQPVHSFHQFYPMLEALGPMQISLTTDSWKNLPQMESCL